MFPQSGCNDVEIRKLSLWQRLNITLADFSSKSVCYSLADEFINVLPESEFNEFEPGINVLYE